MSCKGEIKEGKWERGRWKERSGGRRGRGRGGGKQFGEKELLISRAIKGGLGYDNSGGNKSKRNI